MKATQELVLPDGEGRDRTYAVTQLPARRALKMLHKIGRVLVPTIAQALGSASITDFSSMKKMAGLELGDLGKAAETLFDRMPEADFDALVTELVQGVTLEGKPLAPVFDLHFQGRILDVMKLLRFALKVNFADFFPDLAAQVAAVQTAASSSEGSTT
jgi:hypothetical protein